MKSPSQIQTCQVCAGSPLTELASYRELPRVTSDCLPFRAGGRLLVCARCGATQSPPDPQWFAEIGEIYRDYAVYHQAGGAEQHVFDAASGTLRRRSDVLADRLEAHGIVGNIRGGGRKILDVGCGSGVTLKVFSERGGWQLHGLDQDRRHLEFLEKLPGFAALHTCSPKDLPEKFDLITMVHSLEHFPEPMAVLCDLKSKLAPGGHLLIQVPNAEANPFEYLVADHMVHFSAASLTRLAGRAGYGGAAVQTDWVAKELSLLTNPDQGFDTDPASTNNESASAASAALQIEWLTKFVQAAECAASAAKSAGSPFGLFGSSIAATWLTGVLGPRVSFFVEEDANRIGRTHLGRPIVGVSQVPKGAVVYLALVPAIAGKIAARLSAGFSERYIDLRLPADYVWPKPESSLLALNTVVDQTELQDQFHDTRT